VKEYEDCIGEAHEEKEEALLTTFYIVPEGCELSSNMDTNPLF